MNNVMLKYVFFHFLITNCIWSSNKNNFVILY